MLATDQHDNLYPSSSKQGILHGLGKIHRDLVDGVPTFCPILSAIGTPSHKLIKFLDKLLKPRTTNEYTIKDSFSFTKECEEFDPNLIWLENDFIYKIIFHQHFSYRSYWLLCRESL